MEEEEQEQAVLELGRGNRARKETNYDDQLSEREWLKAIGVRTGVDVKRPIAFLDNGTFATGGGRRL